MVKTYFSPNTGRYAAIRMDPVAMVAHLNDRESLIAAQALCPRTYLIYLQFEPMLPFPGKAWYDYNVWLIGPTLRAPDSENHITANMCTPIYPNTAHPTNRPPIHTNPVFPFASCYHWTCTDMEIRVCGRPEGFDDDEAIRLSVDERFDLIEHQDEDKQVIFDARNPHLKDAPPVVMQELPPVDEDSSDWDEYDEHIPSEESVNIISEMLAGSDNDPELTPLVHLWHDLKAHVQPDDIPSPLQLYEERDAIVKIIQDARARNPLLPPLIRPHPLGLAADLLSSHHDSQVLDDDRSNYSFHADPPQKRIDPLLLIRRLGRRLGRTLRLPYIRVWP